MFFTLLISVRGLQSYAQSVGLNGHYFLANGQFNRNINKNPSGVGYNILFGINDKIEIGGQTSVAMYSSSEYSIPHNNQQVSICEEDCFWTFHAIGRYTLYESTMSRLYAEGQMGFTNFFSSKTPKNEDPNYVSEIKATAQLLTLG